MPQRICLLRPMKIGLMAKGILADMGIIEVKDIYSSFYEQGVKLNKGRRISRSKP